MTEKLNLNNETKYDKSAEDVLRMLDSSINGLSNDEAERRLLRFGENVLVEKEKDSPLKLLLSQFTNLLIVILIISSIISMSVGQTVEATAIIVIVILAGILGFFQEYKAEKAIDSLKKMAALHATVIRDGKEQTIEAEHLVPGDIIVLSVGNTVPADARILETKNLKVNESPLTGESTSIEKISNTINEKLSVADRKNMLYMGTSIVYGRATAIVTATGMNTEFGKIAGMLQSTVSRRTPLQNNLDQLGKKIGIISLVLAFIMGMLGLLIEKQSFVDMFIWGVAIAVAVIPEALPAVVTISIALGVRRMVTRKALIRKLPAVETLGSVNIICSDKTGTLTKDEMTIREVFTNNLSYSVTGTGYNPIGMFRNNNVRIKPSSHLNLFKLLEIGVLCNDSSLEKKGDKINVIGDPTEAAFLVAAEKAELNIEKLKNEMPRLDEIPFTSESKQMTTVHEKNGSRIAYTKGAFEIILANSNTILLNGVEHKLTSDEKLKLSSEAYKLSEKAMRILALAYKKLSKDETIENSQHEMTFVGFVGMIDPPRKEAKKSIKTCFNAGIRPVMITGDYEVTAVAVAREVGILKYGNSIQGSDIEKMSDASLSEIVEDTEVFARIAPKHKLRIVDALMKRGNIVAMTGDGVNDAPALKKADIGIAMGIRGTDVSREAADMILTDDNFSSIVSAIEEGRSIFQNIRKYLVYLLSGNFGTVLGLSIALLTFLPIPLTAVQILFINFLMDGLIAIALGVEPPEKGLMKDKPRNVKEGVLNKQMLQLIGGIGTVIGLVTTTVFYFVLKEGASTDKAITIFFATLIFSRLFNAMNCRSFHLPALSMKFYGNKALFVSYLISIIFTLIVIEVPIFNEPFNTVSLSGGEWLLVLLSSSIVWIVFEIYKLVKLNNKHSN